MPRTNLEWTVACQPGMNLGGMKAFAENQNSMRILWRILLYVSVATAVVPGIAEATVFMHDRFVVHQDFACLDRYLAGIGKKLEEFDMYDTYATCNIATRKPFGHQSSRAWSSGFPMLWLSMDTRRVWVQIIAGLPFLVGVSGLSIKRRCTEPASRWILLVGCWLLLLGSLAALQYPPNLDRLRTEAPIELETTAMTWWWFTRVTSFAWLVAVSTLSGMTVRDRMKQLAYDSP